MPQYPLPDADVGLDPDYEDPERRFIREYREFLTDIGLDPNKVIEGENEEFVSQVRSYLNRAFTEPGDHSSAERLSRAFLFASDDRAEKSTDERLRNVERYLYGLSAAANRDAANLMGIGGAPVYESLKALAHALKNADQPGMEYAMRSDENPTSRPSFEAVGLAYKGVAAGLSIDSGKSFKVTPYQAERFKPHKSGLHGVPDMHFR